MKTNIHFWSYLAEFFLQWGILYQAVEKIKVAFYIQQVFVKIVPVYEVCGKILYSRTDQTKI